MKKLSLILLLAGSAFAQDAKIEGVNFHSAYIPPGFDSNDSNVQLVVEGMLKDSCHQAAMGSAKVNTASKTITVTGETYVRKGLCIQVMTPFHQVYDLKKLPAGKYDVVQPTSESRYELGQLKVKPSSTQSADDYLYAPVTQAYFTYDTNGNPFVRISGYFTNSCMSVKDIKVDVKENVITVLPIAQLKKNTTCNKGRFKFNKSVDISNVELGRYLLHVRTAGSQAINTLIDIDE
ncbi:MAG: hypothetical protein KA715_12585 [Xanthomonadaceae bacterium]|nr:hypothetical protein [Xanthomonadaceae bacterium]